MEKYHMLTLIKFSHNKKRGPQFWHCKCDCGKELICNLTNVKRGNTKSCGCLKNQKRRENSPMWRGFGEISASKFYEYKKNAKRRNLEFNLSIEEAWEQYLKQNGRCSLTNLPLRFQETVDDTNSTASLDRIDSTKGYNVNNIQWVYKEINYMKSDLPTKEFIRLCGLVSKYNPVSF